MGFVHLAVKFKDSIGGTNARLDEIQAVLDTAGDWLRYAPNCWIIYTAQPPATWQQRLHVLPWMKDQEYMLLKIEGKGDANGWMEASVWEWVNKMRQPLAPHN